MFVPMLAKGSQHQMVFIFTVCLFAPSIRGVLISLTFDDTYAEHYAMANILKHYGMKGTFYINSNRIDEVPKYMTLKNIKQLHKDGHEFGGHTLDHVDVTSVSTEDAYEQICVDRSHLKFLKLEPRNFAYPYGNQNQILNDIVKECGYNSARTSRRSSADCTNCAPFETNPPTNMFSIQSYSVTSSETLVNLVETVELEILNNETRMKWLIFSFHRMCERGTTDDKCEELLYSVTRATFVGFVEWLSDNSELHSLQIKTIGEILGGDLNEVPTQYNKPFLKKDLNMLIGLCMVGMFASMTIFYMIYTHCKRVQKAKRAKKAKSQAKILEEM